MSVDCLNKLYCLFSMFATTTNKLLGSAASDVLPSVAQGKGSLLPHKPGYKDKAQRAESSCLPPPSPLLEPERAQPYSLSGQESSFLTSLSH